MIAFDAPPSVRPRLHYGWVIVAAGFTVMLLTYGVQYSFGVFFTALAAEFGWSRAKLGGVFSLYAGTYSFMGLISGRLTDRWGPRRVVAVGGLLLGGGLALAGTVRSLPPLYATYFIAAFGMSTAYVPTSSTAVRWFTARRGLAVGLVMAGAGVGVLVAPPVIALILGRLGWRLTYFVVGATLAVALVALARLLVADPASRGLRPYGGAIAAADGPDAPSWPVARAARHPAFLALAGVYLLAWIPVFLPPVHLAALAQDLGLGPVVGATALSALGGGSLAGRVVMGAASDAIGRRPALGLSLGLQAVAFVALALPTDAASLLGAAALYGFAYGAVTALMPATVTDFFGPAHAGTLVGLIFGIAGPTASLGPVMGGFIFDVTGSYGWAFGAAAGCNVLALGLLAVARPPRRLDSGATLPATHRA
jgi:MFS transporter, OFA family, oxalate/formate antiporter